MEGAVNLFFLQLLVIIAVSRVSGLVFQRFLGQPFVVGEMFAGVLLGPSVLGTLNASMEQCLFPTASLSNLWLVGQLGLTLYLFMMGLKIDIGPLQRRHRSIAAISFTSTLLPVLAGFALTWWLQKANVLHMTSSHSALSASLVLGAVLGSTALPVLYSMLQEWRLDRSELGSTAIVIACINDVLDCFFLSLALCFSEKNTGLSSVTALFFMTLFWLTFGKHFLNWYQDKITKKADGLRTALPVAILLLLLSVAVGNHFGVQSSFAAFITGMAFPRALAKETWRHLEGLLSVILLPVFLTYSGLNTVLGNLNTPSLWVMTLGIIVVATIARIAGCFLSASLCGWKFPDALRLGILLNTRGVVGLAILNIGLKAGYIQQPLFTMLVLMDLTTTLMTTPLLALLAPHHESSTKQKSIVGVEATTREGILDERVHSI